MAVRLLVESEWAGIALGLEGKVEQLFGDVNQYFTVRRLPHNHTSLSFSIDRVIDKGMLLGKSVAIDLRQVESMDDALVDRVMSELKKRRWTNRELFCEPLVDYIDLYVPFKESTE